MYKILDSHDATWVGGALTREQRKYFSKQMLKVASAATAQWVDASIPELDRLADDRDMRGFHLW
eukprot:SAG31_NODE_32905_length_350_cov_0.940239_1_plen_63_part_01